MHGKELYKAKRVIPAFYFIFIFILLIAMSLNVDTPPVDTKDLPIFPRFTPHELLSRCKFSTRTTRHLMDGCIITFSLRKKKHKFWFDKN